MISKLEQKDIMEREIAEIIGKSHITVRNNLTNKLKYADASKYEKVMEKISLM